MILRGKNAGPSLLQPGTMTVVTMHADQLDDIGVPTVRALVDQQFPQWRGLAVTQIDSSGTLNAIFRIGDELAARFPLLAQEVAEARAMLAAEAAAALELAAVASVATPEPVAIGEPGFGYPLPWSVQTWLDGVDATIVDPAGSPPFVDDLATFIESLRRADTRGRRFTGNGRGGHLPDHDEWVELCLRNSEGLFDVRRLRSLWGELRTLPELDDDLMCHGDLTPANVLVRDGRLAGVLDPGGFGPADPALDLVSGWHLLDGSGREQLQHGLGCSDIQWLRGEAWALQQAVGLPWYYAESNPTMAAWGRRTLDRILFGE